MVSIYGLSGELAEVAYWACDQLKISDAELIFEIGEFSYSGELYEYEDEVFTIFLSSKISHLTMLKTIFHELTHVKQVLDGRLAFNEDPHTWMGVNVRMFLGKVKYNHLPWEIEAYRNENVLLGRYKKPVYALT